MGQILTSSAVVCYINGLPFGRVANIDIDISHHRKLIKTVDVLRAAEIVQQGYDINGSVTIFKLHSDGGVEAAGMAGVQADLNREKYFTILLVDRVTDTTIWQAPNCSVTSQRWSYTRGLIIGNIGFQSLTISNETDPSPA